MPQTRINTRLFRILNLFPLNRSGGFGGDVVDDAVDAVDLVGDAVGDGCEDIIRNSCPVCGHEVIGCDGTDRNDILVCSVIAHNADRL